MLTVILTLLKQEEEASTRDQLDVLSTYKQAFRLIVSPRITHAYALSLSLSVALYSCCMPLDTIEMRTLLLCLLLSKIPFAVADSVMPFKLVERGFRREWFGTRYIVLFYSIFFFSLSHTHC
jgi:hypothetical protein